jgi:lysophospholipase L1-like esterase
LKGISSFRMWVNLVSGAIRSARGDPNAWESSIRDFETQDKLQAPMVDGILFLGSSTFTLWSTIEHDLSPLAIVNRGFGGSKMADMTRYFERVVLPHRPRAIVLFAGTNDIADPKPASAQDVFDGYLQFVNRVMNALPDTQVYYVAITPTPSRWKYWALASEANQMIQAHSSQDARLHFIDPTAKFLDHDGKPDRRFFRMDRLHPNKRGYALLAQSIKQALEADQVSER